MVITAKFLVKNRRVIVLFDGMICRDIGVIRCHTSDIPATERKNAIPYSALKYKVDGGLATISLDRPETGNRIDEEMAAELRELAGELGIAEGIGVVILTGTGEVFSSGREEPLSAEHIVRLQAASAIAGLTMPVLVALNGDATDHGLELALAGDMRIASGESRFGFASPSESSFHFDGATQRLPRLVGPGWARDMLLTGRMLDAREALSIGLVNRVVEPDEDVAEAARELALQVVKGSPLGARYAKEAVSSAGDLTLGQGLVLEADLNVILQSTADRAEGIASFLERRDPNFTGE